MTPAALRYVVGAFRNPPYAVGFCYPPRLEAWVNETEIARFDREGYG
jgi:hypothetical protein